MPAEHPETIDCSLHYSDEKALFNEGSLGQVLIDHFYRSTTKKTGRSDAGKEGAWPLLNDIC
ncbi:hypothetical protein SBDP1_500012 [Syntrophobacter sp. SbD1]|nr:hypothetical protein SBDP1_500012 [Syntrophobacter sp. SbD1]